MKDDIRFNKLMDLVNGPDYVSSSSYRSTNTKTEDLLYFIQQLILEPISIDNLGRLLRTGILVGFEIFKIKNKAVPSELLYKLDIIQQTLKMILIPIVDTMGLDLWLDILRKMYTFIGSVIDDKFENVENSKEYREFLIAFKSIEGSPTYGKIHHEMFDWQG